LNKEFIDIQKNAVMLGNISIPSVYIVILNWNGINDTIECIKSLRKINFNNYKIIVVDNASEENEGDLIKNTFPEIVLIKSSENLGFSGGNNIGIKYAIERDCDLVLLLNNDTIVEKDFLDKLVSHIQPEDIAITVPKINYFDDRNKIWYSGGYVSKIKGSAFTLGEGKMSRQCYKENKEVSFATGCCLLIKSDLFKKIGFLDENYFLYLEDADFCIRTISAGYKILYVADSQIYHKVNQSSKKGNGTIPLYYNTRNRLFLMKKYYNHIFLIPFLYVTSSFIIKSFIWILKKDLNKAKAVTRGIRDFLKNKMGKTEFT
jgi:GT2 family glycosyltransferase